MKNEFIKKSFKSYKQKWINKTASASLFGLSVVGSIFLGLFSPITFFISVPFLVLPLLLGFIADNILSDDPHYKNGNIFLFFKLYFTREMFGGFRVLIGFLKSIPFYFAVSILVGVILYFVIGKNDPSFVSIIENMQNVANFEDLQPFIEDLQVNSSYILIVNCSELAAIFVASYVFIHHILVNSLKYYFNLLQPKPVDMRGVNIIHNYTFKKISKSFYKDYYSSIWFLIILYILGYALGIVLSLLALNLTGISAALFSLLVAFLFVLYLLPYLFSSLLLMFKKYSRYYFKSIVDITKDEYERMKSNLKEGEKLSEEEDIKSVIDDFGNALKEAEEEQDKENK